MGLHICGTRQWLLEKYARHNLVPKKNQWVCAITHARAIYEMKEITSTFLLCAIGFQT